MQLAINALLAASLYALVAMGLTIILGVLDIADFAQGALYMLGAFTAFYATTLLGLGFYLALPLGFLVGGAIGVANYLAVYRPLRRASGATTFIAALGLLLILQNLALWIFGADFKLVPSPFGKARVSLLGASMGSYQLFLIAAVAVVVLATWAFLQRTRLGMALRAVSQNRNGALMIGVDALRVEVTAFAVAGGLAGLGGALASAVNAFDPSVAALVVIKAFAIVIFGGMGSVPGALLGAVIVGVMETATAGLVNTQYAELTAFVLMVVVLLVRPRGLLGSPETKL